MLRSRWSLVTAALAAPLASTAALEAAVMSYNTRYAGHADWSFAGLHHLFAEVLEEEEAEAFFATTLPGMVKLLVSSPTVLTAPLPLLKAGMSHSITLSQHQVATCHDLLLHHHTTTTGVRAASERLLLHLPPAERHPA